MTAVSNGVRCPSEGILDAPPKSSAGRRWRKILFYVWLAHFHKRIVVPLTCTPSLPPTDWGPQSQLPSPA